MMIVFINFSFFFVVSQLTIESKANKVIKQFKSVNLLLLQIGKSLNYLDHGEFES